VRTIFLFLFIVLLSAPSLSLAQNDQGYAETVAWWRGVIQTLQPYRLQLQNMYAETEAQLRFSHGKIEPEFRKRLAKSYPGSVYFASVGGSLKINGYTTLGYDRTWHIHRLSQKLGNLTKSYDFRQNMFTVEQGSNRIIIKLDPDRPQRSVFSGAEILSVVVTAEQVWDKKSSPTIFPTPLKDILNDVYAAGFALTSGTRMDELAEKMVRDETTRQQVFALANELYGNSGWQSPPSHQIRNLSVSLKQLAQQQGRTSPNRNNPLSAIPWYGWLLAVGLIAFILHIIRERKRSKRPRRQTSDADDFSMGGEPTPARTEPAPAENPKSPEPEVPQRWSLEVLRSLEWKRFETVCAEYFKLNGYVAKETDFGPDGGIDIWIYKEGVEKPLGIVQCKAWNVYKVGVKEVRELYGVMASEEVPRGWFMATGVFTDEATAFAENKKLRLFSGELFLSAILKLSPEKQQDLLAIAVEGDYRTPTCPQCGVKMVLRQGQGQQRDFWGCPKHPRCNGRLNKSHIN